MPEAISVLLTVFFVLVIGAIGWVFASSAIVSVFVVVVQTWASARRGKIDDRR